VARTNIDIDEEACAEVMRHYQLRTKQEAVNLALNMLTVNPLVEPLSAEEALQMQGTGWEGDLDEMRA
jgi:Arc/MetJ family transcription regulator